MIFFVGPTRGSICVTDTSFSSWVKLLLHINTPGKNRESQEISLGEQNQKHMKVGTEFQGYVKCVSTQKQEKGIFQMAQQGTEQKTIERHYTTTAGSSNTKAASADDAIKLLILIETHLLGFYFRVPELSIV
jgi:hypothetical protein